MAISKRGSQAEIYQDAALEHVTVARDLYDAQSFVLAGYVAGLATECILRAYRHRIDPEFDSRHDIDRLYKLAKFVDLIPREKIESVTASLDVVIALWSNDHRFLSLEALRKRWLKQKRHVGVKGDFVKE